MRQKRDNKYPLGIVLCLSLILLAFATAQGSAAEEDLTKTIDINYPDKTVGKTNGVAVVGAVYTFRVLGAPGGSTYKWEHPAGGTIGGTWTGGGSSKTFTPDGTKSDTKYSFTVKVYPPGEGGEGEPWQTSGAEILDNPIITFNEPETDVYVQEVGQGQSYSPIDVVVTVTHDEKTLPSVTVNFQEKGETSIGTFVPSSPSTGSGESGSGVAATEFTLKSTAKAGDSTTLQAKCGATVKDGKKVTVVKVELMEVSFSGTGRISMKKQGSDGWENDTYSNNGDTNIVNPVWKDSNLDGDVNDAGDKDEPSCYIQGSSPTINAKLKITPTISSSVPATLIVEQLDSPDDPLNYEKAITLTGSEVSVTGMTTSGELTNLVDNFGLQFRWKLRFEDNSEYVIHDNTEHVFFQVYAAPKGTYCSNISTYNWSSLSLTAKRLDWAAWVGRKESAKNSIAWKVAERIKEDPDFSGDYYSNPFSHLDADHSGDCICLANLSVTALRLVGIESGPRRAYTQNAVDPDNEDMWGWDKKSHPYESWWLGYPGNNFEGFFYLETLNLYTQFPTDAYTVAPLAYTQASSQKAKYLALKVLHIPTVGATVLRWRPSGNQPDAKWKPNDTITGVSIKPTDVSWSDELNEDYEYVDDGEYSIAWDKSGSTLALDGGTPVTVTGDGEYTLTCDKGSIKVNVVEDNLPGTDDSGTVRIVPARNLAAVP